MSRKSIIVIVIIAVVIIIGIVGFLIYKKNKDKAENKDKAAQQAAAEQAAMLQAQLNANPNMPAQQKAGIIEQLAALALQIQAAKGGTATPPIASPNPLPGLGGGIWVNSASFPLRSGSNNSYVANLQLALNKKCGKNLVADGKFGPLTQSAVQSCIGGTTISTDQYKTYIS